MTNTMVEKKYIDAKKEIRSVLLTYKEGVSLNEFIKTYKSLIGERLPSRSLGFSSDLDFLQSMPDAVHIFTSDIGKICLIAIADDSSQHIQQLVSKQKKPKTNSSSKNFQQPYKSVNNHESLPFVPGQIRAQFIQVAIKYPDGISLSSFILAYNRMFNKSLQLKNGLETLENMIGVISDLEIKTVRNEKKIFCKNFQHESSHKKACKVDKRYNLSQLKEGNKNQVLDESNDSRFVDNSGISPAIQKNFIKVLEKYPEGIIAVHFPLLYENVTGQPFEMLDYGYNSFLDLVDALPWIFRRILDPSNNKYWIILSADSSVKCIQKSEDPVSHTKSCDVKIQKNVPSDAASPLVRYKPPVMPGNIDFNEYLPIFVSAIINPLQFWFQLELTEEIEEFKKLENDISSFYNSSYNYTYKMYDADIFIGATCVVQCQEDKQWYRAVIKAIPTMDFINVLFVDYGSRENVPRSMLRYSRNKYMDYPAHAFSAELAGVKPANLSSAWDSKSIQRFIYLCTCTSLMAHIIPMDNNTFSTYLCDTSKDCDVHINDILVKEGFADSCFENPISECNIVRKLPIFDTSSEAESDVDIYTRSYSSKKCSDNNDYAHMISKEDHVLPINKKLNYPTEKEYDKVKEEYYIKRYVKRLKLEGGYIFHIINFENNLHLPVGDLSKLLWREEDSSYLSERLLNKEEIIPTTLVSEEMYPELFKQCKWYKLVDLESNASCLNLYSIENSLHILDIFGHPSLCVKLIFDYEIRKFDPLHHFWHEFFYDDWEDFEKEIERENLGTLCLLDLKKKMEATKIKLKLLKMNDACDSTEVKEIEHLQHIIQRRINYIKNIHSEDY